VSIGDSCDYSQGGPVLLRSDRVDVLDSNIIVIVQAPREQNKQEQEQPEEHWEMVPNVSQLARSTPREVAASSSPLRQE